MTTSESELGRLGPRKPRGAAHWSRTLVGVNRALRSRGSSLASPVSHSGSPGGRAQTTVVMRRRSRRAGLERSELLVGAGRPEEFARLGEVEPSRDAGGGWPCRIAQAAGRSRRVGRELRVGIDSLAAVRRSCSRRSRSCVGAGDPIDVATNRKPPASRELDATPNRLDRTAGRMGFDSRSGPERGGRAALDSAAVLGREERALAVKRAGGLRARLGRASRGRGFRASPEARGLVTALRGELSRLTRLAAFDVAEPYAGTASTWRSTSGSVGRQRASVIDGEGRSSGSGA